MASKSTPITISIPTEDLEQLKALAAYLTKTTGETVTYGELIRKSIPGWKTVYDMDLVNKEYAPAFKWLTLERKFWTDQDVVAFNKSDEGQMVQEALATRNWQPFVTYFDKIAKEWLKAKSIYPHLLTFRESTSPKDLGRISRDPAAIAYVIARRGAIPEMVSEGEEIVTPSFTVANNTRIRYAEQEPWFLFQSAGKAIMAIQKEVDSNVLNSFKHSVRSEQAVFGTGSFTTEMFSKAIKNIAQHDLIPSIIIMHPADYTDLHMSFGHEFLSAPPLKIALETQDYGCIAGIPIRLTTRMAIGDILVAASPDMTGVYFENTPPTMTWVGNPTKEADHFITTTNLRLCIVNDYAFSLIQKDVETDKSKEERLRQEQDAIEAAMEEKMGVPPMARKF